MTKHDSKLSQMPAWPEEPQAFFSLPEVSNEQARLTAVALCDERGRPQRRFSQGERVVVYTEWDIRASLAERVLSSGVVLRDAAGNVVFGKNTYQMDQEIRLVGLRPGWRLRARYVLTLRVAPGEYRLTVGLAHAEPKVYESYRKGEIGYAEFAASIAEILRAEGIGSLRVELPQGKLLHHGVTDLVEEAAFEGLPPNRTAAPREASAPILLHSSHATEGEDPLPALIHVTHQKAGSQWVHRILRSAFPSRIVSPTLENRHFTQGTVKQGKVYPTVYLSKEQFDKVPLPPKWYRFVVVRDLRDTMVSAYFSLKVSHPPVGQIPVWRARLNDMGQEEGLLWVLKQWLPPVARIQASWWEAGERLIRYEDLLQDDVRIFKRVLIDEAGWPIAPERLEEIVIAHRFENLTGRRRGEEDVKAHERKGMAGDWRNYFTPRIKEMFKAYYGGLLVALGYERDLSW